MRFLRKYFMPALLVGALVALSAGLMSGLTAGCGPSRSREAPPQLIGVWTTTHPRYHGRYFEIRPASFIIGIDEEQAIRHPLRVVESMVIGGRQHYTLRYEEADGSTSTFRFFFDGTIRQVSQEDIEWTKTELPDDEVTKS